MIDKTGSFRDNGLRIFLRTVKVRSTEQSGIKGVKILFDPDIILLSAVLCCCVFCCSVFTVIL